MADGFDTRPCEPNQSDCQEVSQYTFDTQVGSAYNVSRAIAEQWQVIEKLKQDVGEVADKTAVKDYNGNIFKNLTLKGENGVNVDISEDDPEQLNISLDQDITNQIEINAENIISLENTTDSLDTRVTQTETSITELTPDVARALKTPLVTPTETKLVAVDTTNSQEMINIGETLTSANNTLNVDINKLINPVVNVATVVSPQSGDVSYIKIGKLVLVHIEDFRILGEIIDEDLLIEGLPIGIRSSDIFLLVGSKDNQGTTVRIRLDEDGKIRVHFDHHTPSGYDKSYCATFWYVVE